MSALDTVLGQTVVLKVRPGATLAHAASRGAVVIGADESGLVLQGAGAVLRASIDLTVTATTPTRGTHTSMANGLAYSAFASARGLEFEHIELPTDGGAPRVVQTAWLARGELVLESVTANDEGALVVWSEDGGRWATIERLGLATPPAAFLGPAQAPAVVGAERSRWRILQADTGLVRQLLASVGDGGVWLEEGPAWAAPDCPPSTASRGERVLAACAQADTVRMAWLDAPEDLVTVTFDAGVGEVAAATLDGGAVLAVTTDDGWNGRAIRAAWVTQERADGAPCHTDGECGSSHCVDGVCCDSPCGAGVRDCQACSRAEGGLVDGVCSLLPAGIVCAAAQDDCHADSRCDGQVSTCSPAALPDGTACALDDGGGACVVGVCEPKGAPVLPRFREAEGASGLDRPTVAACGCGAGASVPTLLALIALLGLRRERRAAAIAK